MEGFRMTHPEFVDNQGGNTLERALRERLRPPARDPPRAARGVDRDGVLQP